MIVGGVAGVWGNLARSDTDGWGTVTISGGNIDVSNSLSDGSTKTCQVTGGTFNKDFSRYVTGGRSMVLNADGRWQICRAKGTYWTAFDTPTGQIKVILNGTLKGPDDNLTADATALKMNDIRNALGVDANHRFAKVSAAAGTKFVGDLSNVFAYQNIATLDLSKVDTSQMFDMTAMFAHVYADSIDLSNFNTSNVVTMQDMFNDCTNTLLKLNFA